MPSFVTTSGTTDSVTGATIMTIRKLDKCSMFMIRPLEDKTLIIYLKPKGDFIHITKDRPCVDTLGDLNVYDVLMEHFHACQANDGHVMINDIYDLHLQLARASTVNWRIGLYLSIAVIAILSVIYSIIS